MLARIQQIITITFAGLLIVGTGYWLIEGPAWKAVAWSFGLLAAHPTVLAIEFALLPLLRGRDPSPCPSPRTLVTAWWAEVRTATTVFGWRQPWRSRAEPDHLEADVRGRTGQVMVHGFFCNRALWNPWMRKLRAAGVPFCAVSLEPVFGSIDLYPAAVEQAVAMLEGATGRPPVIVGHSMGGLAVRAWLKATGADQRVKHVVTVATPHQGTRLARFAFVANARQMRRRSEWLGALRSSERSRRRAAFTCFYSNCDNIVMPPHAATLSGADNRFLAGTAHVCLVYRDEVFAEVERLLAL